MNNFEFEDTPKHKKRKTSPRKATVEATINTTMLKLLLLVG